MAPSDAFDLDTSTTYSERMQELIATAGIMYKMGNIDDTKYEEDFPTPRKRPTKMQKKIKARKRRLKNKSRKQNRG